MVTPLENWFTRYFWNFYMILRKVCNWDFKKILTPLWNMYVRLQPRFSWIGWLANFELVCWQPWWEVRCCSQSHPNKVLWCGVTSHCYSIKGIFFSESAIHFLNLQTSRKKYSKKLSWTWNLKFPPITALCYGREF